MEIRKRSRDAIFQKKKGDYAMNLDQLQNIELEDFLSEEEANEIISKERKRILSVVKCGSQNANTSQATEVDTTGFCGCCV